MTKRVFDIGLSMILLVVVLPLFIVTTLLVLVKMGGPVFFRQQRPGLQGKPFELIKFRTMLDTCDSGGILLSDEQRLTRFGRFLRASSLDELPELWNVLKGDMSLVGPRPLLMEYLPLYSHGQARRHEVRPGLTGWAQINGRNSLSWEEKFQLDVWYVDNQSIFLDLKILWVTIVRVFQRDGISSSGHATMPAFRGDNEDGSGIG